MEWVILVGVLLAVAALVLGRARDARLARMIGREVRKRDRDDTDNDL
ncbi:MAG TPA: hypothetical protein VFR67_06680 [Pilimelia sp.]|nr:hypothetical protein [Pilimelia sp.]